MRSRCKILILGEPVSAGVLSRKLNQLGYETVLQSKVGLARLPPVGDPESLKILKDVFLRFASLIEADSATIGIIHPGTSAWAERPELIPMANRLNLRLISPPARTQYLFGNQLYLLAEAEKLGIPNLIQTADPMYTVRELEDFLGRSGQRFPFILRAVRGGGCLSSILVRDEVFLRSQVSTWCDQLRRSLGEVIFVLEKYIEGARQVLVPFVRFRNGRIQLFPTSDVSLQSRHRKLIEFCPAHSIEPHAQTLLLKWTAHLIESFDFVGLGHFEFLVDGSRVFLESGATRLNTGFHLWEEIAGTNALAWQMAAADLQAIHPEVPQEIIPRDQRRQGLMLKIMSEDSHLLLPRPGVISESLAPAVVTEGSEVLEFFQNYQSGDRVDPQDSGTVAHLFAFADQFEKAMQLGWRGLNDVWLGGSLSTNEKFLSELMSHPWVREGIFHFKFVDEEFLPACQFPMTYASPMVQAVSEHPSLLSKIEGLHWWVNDRRMSEEACSQSPWSWAEPPQFWIRDALPGVSGMIRFSGEPRESFRICAYPTAPGRWNVRVGQWFFTLKNGAAHRRAPSREQWAATQGLERKTSKLLSQVAGQVRALLFLEGTLIQAREPVLTVESFGELVPHCLPFSIRVTHWKVGVNDQVVTGQILAELEIIDS